MLTTKPKVNALPIETKQRPAPVKAAKAKAR